MADRELKEPAIPLDVIEWLERLYPDRSPVPTDHSRHIWMRAGQAALIRKLRHTHEKQTGPEHTVL